MGGGRKGKKSKKSKAKPRKLSGREKAQQMAKARIGTGTAKKPQRSIKSIRAANQQSMRDAAKKRNESFQAARKAKSDAKKTSGIGPVKSGAQYAKSLSTAKNQPTKKTTGVGPYADGAKYAAALKASPPRFADGTKVASHDKPLFKSVPARLDQPASKDYIDGMLQRNINPAKPGDMYGIGTKTAMLPGDNMGGPAAVIGGLGTMTIMGANAIKNTIQNLAPKFKEKMEQRVNPDADKLSFAGDIGGLGIGAGAPSYFSVKSPESFGAPSQEAVDKAAGITAGGLNVGGSGFTPSSPSSGSTSRALSDGTSGVGPVADGDQYARNVVQARFPGASPNSAVFGMNAAQLNQSGGPFNQTGPGGPEPEADYTSYQPGSFYNLSDTNMNPTNFLRSTRNVVTTPFRALGINNRFTNMLIPKSNEAIQDARDQRGPRPTLTRRGGGGGARLPVAPLTPEEILLPEQVAAAQTSPDYQQAAGQTGVDPNRLMQIQQEAYARAFNPLTVGGFNPFFRFFDRRGGARRGAFRRAFRRD